MTIYAFPPRPPVAEDYRPLTDEEMAVINAIAPAPYWHVTDAEAAQIEAERDRSRGTLVILMLALVLAAQLGFIIGVSSALAVQNGWW